jgi:hypothetical protein
MEAGVTGLLESCAGKSLGVTALLLDIGISKE